MRIYYALYDSSVAGSVGNNWTWKSSVIPAQFLELIYYRFLIKNKPESPNSLTARDLWGGVLATQDWLVVYRYYNGGRDTQGRPGRYCILTGWIPRETCDSAILWELQTGAFNALAQRIPSCPVAPLKSLEEVRSGDALSIEPNPTLEQKLAMGTPYAYPSGTAVESAIQDLLSIPNPNAVYHLKIQQRQWMSNLQLSLVSTPAATSKPSVASATQPLEMPPLEMPQSEKRSWKKPLELHDAPLSEDVPLTLPPEQTAPSKNKKQILIAMLGVLAIVIAYISCMMSDSPKTNTPEVADSTAVSLTQDGEDGEDKDENIVPTRRHSEEAAPARNDRPSTSTPTSAHADSETPHSPSFHEPVREREGREAPLWNESDEPRAMRHEKEPEEIDEGKDTPDIPDAAPIRTDSRTVTPPPLPLPEEEPEADQPDEDGKGKSSKKGNKLHQWRVAGKITQMSPTSKALSIDLPEKTTLSIPMKDLTDEDLVWLKDRVEIKARIPNTKQVEAIKKALEGRQNENSEDQNYKLHIYGTFEKSDGKCVYIKTEYKIKKGRITDQNGGFTILLAQCPEEDLDFIIKNHPDAPGIEYVKNTKGRIEAIKDKEVYNIFQDIEKIKQSIDGTTPHYQDIIDNAKNAVEAIQKKALKALKNARDAECLEDVIKYKDEVKKARDEASHWPQQADNQAKARARAKAEAEAEAKKKY